MHVELVVPALFSAEDAAPAPAAELLLARGRRTGGEAESPEQWLARAFNIDGNSLPAGALTAFSAGLATDGGAWLRADPVHLRADRDRLLMMPSQAFELSQLEADALAGALAPLLAGKFTLHVVRPDQWCLRMDQKEESASTRPPIEFAGANVDPHLPPKLWHPLLTELQMALYEHAVNTVREARGAPVVNSLWLWGAGKLPAAATGPWQSVSAEDPVALGLARLAGMRHRSPGTGAEEWLARAPEEGRHLVLLEDLRGARALGDYDAFQQRLAALEARWFAPLLAALRAGRIGMATIRVPDAGLSFETVRGDLPRFWRRPRPLSGYANHAAAPA